jgi:cardiolipin synthase
MQKITTLPNIITVTRGMFGFLGIVIAIEMEMFFVGAIVFFLLGMMPDLLDGWVARRYKQQSRLGEFLDPFVDKLLFYGAMFLVFLPYIWAPALVVLLICDIISTILHFVLPGGAVICGKRKFVLQCVSLGLFFF